MVHYIAAYHRPFYHQARLEKWASHSAASLTGDEQSIDLLRDYARRVHCGLIFNGGFVDRETLNVQSIISYDMMSEINAGNFLARRSFEDVRTKRGILKVID